MLIDSLRLHSFHFIYADRRHASSGLTDSPAAFGLQIGFKQTSDRLRAGFRQTLGGLTE